MDQQTTVPDKLTYVAARITGISLEGEVALEHASVQVDVQVSAEGTNVPVKGGSIVLNSLDAKALNNSFGLDKCSSLLGKNVKIDYFGGKVTKIYLGPNTLL